MDSSFAEAHRISGYRVCDKACNTDTSLLQEHINYSVREGTNQLNASGPDVNNDLHSLKYEGDNQSATNPSVSSVIGDENHNYLNGSKLQTKESRTTEKKNLKEIEGIDSTKSETEFKVEAIELISGKLLKMEPDDKLRSSYFENIGFLSSQTSMNDEPGEGRTCISKVSSTNITQACRSAKDRPLSSSEDAWIEDKPSVNLDVARTDRNSGTFLRDESVRTDSCKNDESMRESSKAYGGASLSTSMSLLESKVDLFNCILKIYLIKNICWINK